MNSTDRLSSPGSSHGLVSYAVFLNTITVNTILKTITVSLSIWVYKWVPDNAGGIILQIMTSIPGKALAVWGTWTNADLTLFLGATVKQVFEYFRSLLWKLNWNYQPDMKEKLFLPYNKQCSFVQCFEKYSYSEWSILAAVLQT